MIKPEHQKVSLKCQCRLLDINRSSVYYKPRPIKEEDLELMKMIDDHYMKHPTSGSRTIRDYLKRQGYKINRKRVQRLMRLMDIEAIYPKPRTSTPASEASDLPLSIERS
ncbi:hypothetical protein JCM14469_19750 [Desulfatiferula olefinivorans]